MNKLLRMKNQVQKYAWGTPDYIANLLQINKTNKEPWAELWLGSHPKASSILTDLNLSLDKAIAQYPEQLLGKTCATLFEQKLPYLLKILSAQKPLSIQAHPNLEQAKSGFAKENKQNIALTDFMRNYQDANHKPELLCALTEFHAMCGFRPALEIIEIIKQMEIDPLLMGFHKFADNPNVANFKLVFTEILDSKMEKKQQLLAMVVRNLHLIQSDFIRNWIVKMLDFYPNDIGAIMPLFLNTFTLNPGEAIFLKAGVLHAYLEGTGVEIMANSDNVLRGGLTSKNIDVAELVSILNWEMEEPEIQASGNDQEIREYQVPVPEFSLRKINLTKELTLPNSKPAILIVIEGKVVVECDNEKQNLKQGESLFVTGEAREIQLTGTALIFVASVNN